MLSIIHHLYIDWHRKFHFYDVIAFYEINFNLEQTTYKSNIAIGASFWRNRAWRRKNIIITLNVCNRFQAMYRFIFDDERSRTFDKNSPTTNCAQIWCRHKMTNSLASWIGKCEDFLGVFFWFSGVKFLADLLQILNEWR